MAGRTEQSGMRASIPVLGEAPILIQHGLTVVLPDSIDVRLSSASAQFPCKPHNSATASVFNEH